MLHVRRDESRGTWQQIKWERGQVGMYHSSYENPSMSNLVRSMVLSEESDMNNQTNSLSSLDNTSSSPTILMSINTGNDKTNTISNSSLDLCHYFKRGSRTYGARCKFVHINNDFRPRLTNPSYGSTVGKGYVTTSSGNSTRNPNYG
uniref:RNI-like superfamily protein n=1 Tax=Tanacetum cinerariifolium TaxID=118510 RepID=A0A6L2J9T1_TANCI|nr:RNI-like superfamily protein [Tanacetum cinerariifolium]